MDRADRRMTNDTPARLLRDRLPLAGENLLRRGISSRAFSEGEFLYGTFPMAQAHDRLRMASRQRRFPRL
jgi:hypothetical protein